MQSTVQLFQFACTGTAESTTTDTTISAGITIPPMPFTVQQISLPAGKQPRTYQISPMQLGSQRQASKLQQPTGM